jgi:hypothetical protein
VVKGDFMVVFEDFHARGKFVKSINSIFISLILKTHGAKEIKDFCPVSLVVEFIRSFPRFWRIE